MGREYDDIAAWQKKVIAEKEWERQKRNPWNDPYRQPVPWRKPRGYPPSSEPDYGDNPFGPGVNKPAPKKRKRKKPSKPKKPKPEPSRITPGVPVRDLILDD